MPASSSSMTCATRWSALPPMRLLQGSSQRVEGNAFHLQSNPARPAVAPYLGNDQTQPGRLTIISLSNTPFAISGIVPQQLFTAVENHNLTRRRILPVLICRQLSA